MPASGRQFSARLAVPLLFFGALWFILCRQLSGEWSVNEQYNYGWFVPFFALYLFWLRWQDRPGVAAVSDRRENHAITTTVRDRRYNKARLVLLLAIPALLLLVPVRLFEIANPEWRLLAWIHASVVVTLTLLYLWCVGGKPWVRHFAFPVAFFFVAVPWPSALEVPVIQGLMRMVADFAAETAMLLGTPAQVEGNLIRVSNGLVGVNEACSGIRSLQTSLMIGLLFGELKRFSFLRRVALVAGAAAIALLANFFRAVFLVQVAARKDLSGVTRWHDLTGYTIVVLVFVGTMLLAYWVGRSQTSNQQSAISNQKSGASGFSFVLRSPYLAAGICWLLFVEIGSAAWYRIHETDLVSGIRWSVRWPKAAPEFREMKINEEMRAVLRFDEGEGASWMLAPPTTDETRHGSTATGPQMNRTGIVVCSLFVFRWNPGKNSALLANLHRPDVCLPASGWKQLADDGVRTYPTNGSFELPFRHFEFQRSFEGSPPQVAHAFYCLSEDRASVSSASNDGRNWPGMFGNRSEWTRTERFRAVLEGRRHLGQQVMQVIFVCPEPLSAGEAEMHLRDLVRDVIITRGNENG